MVVMHQCALHAGVGQGAGHADLALTTGAAALRRGSVVLCARRDHTRAHCSVFFSNSILNYRRQWPL